MMDMQYKPHFLVAVPRLFETIYRGVQQKFAVEKGLKKKLISLFTATSMAYIKARRYVQGLVIRDSPPNLIQKVGSRTLTMVVLC